MSLYGSASGNIKTINSFQYQNYDCPFCASRIFGRAGSPISCNFCEMHIEKWQIERLRPDIRALLVSKKNLLANNSWDAAAKTVEQIIKLDQSPQMLFAAATFYEAYSNYFWHSVNYNLNGYMEQNSVNREFSWQLLSKSKTLLFEAIKECSAHLKTTRDINLAFVKLLAEAKLSRLFDAKETLKMINSAPDPDPLKDYANMVYLSHLGDSKHAAPYIQRAALTELNAFYYIAMLLAKEKKNDEAKRILLPMLAKTNMPRAMELLFKIEDVERTA